MTSRLARTTLAALALATAATTTGLAIATAADAGTGSGARGAVTRLDPESLERGADASVPHVEGRRIVDDGVTTRVRGDWFHLLGTRPDGAYVVLVGDGDGESVRAIIPGGGATTLLADTAGSTVRLGSDGTTLVAERFKNRPRRHTVLRAHDAATGDLLASRKRGGAVTALDASATTVVYAGETGQVVSWDLVTGEGTRVSRRLGYRADLASDRLAVFTDDPYQGGCTVVSTLSDPGTALWRDCDEAVVEFSPDGSHLMTVFELADGLGPDEVRVRTVSGEQTGRYRVPDGYVGQLLFEDGDTALVEAWTRDASGLARCDSGSCELASDLGGGSPYL